jgi:hypothetical protein
VEFACDSVSTTGLQEAIVWAATYHDCGVCVVLEEQGVLVSGDRQRPLGGVDIV